MNINVAGYFLNKLIFSVTKDGAVATGTSTIDADTGETTAQIATKISKATNIKLNYNYWNTKAVQDNLPALRDILVNDHILTKAEASLITGANATTITKAGQISLNLTVNDYKTSSNASLNTDVVNDGHSASQIASEINGSGFGLKVNTAGMYADSSYVTKNFDNLLTANYGISASDLNYVSLPHIKLKVDNPQTKGQVLKDGQTAIATVDLECKTSPYIYYYIVNNNYVQAYVNLNAKFISYLKSYFPGKSNWKILQYFYNMLDDGNDSHLQDYTGTSLIPWANRLDQNMKTFGNTDDPPSQILKYESDDSISSTNSFAQQLYNAVMHSNNELSIMFEWRYYMHTIFEKNYETKQWKFW